ncbi:MAG TPA: S16 family serine protease [Actinomycetota bacterium]
MRIRRVLGISAVVLVGLTLIAAAWVRLPYYSIGPGPARDIPPMILFEDRARYEPDGRLVMTTVRTVRLTGLLALAAWLDPERTIVSESDLYGPGVDRDLEERRSISQMDSSKIAATVVVLSRLADYPQAHGDGVLIESTVPGCPADGELFPGDVVLAIDGGSVDRVAEASAAIDATPIGQEMRWLLDVDGEREKARFARAACLEGSDPLVGVRMLDTFPFPVTISSGEVGGPSAGLMFALGLWELLTPGDLLDRRVVAGTGTIDLDGNVGPIGGVRDKVLGAEHAGADLFLVPTANFREVRDMDTGTMRVVPVADFDEALAALREGASRQLK